MKCLIGHFVSEKVFSCADESEFIFNGVSSRQTAPRLFCDICDEFDLHDTEDCPKQVNKGHFLKFLSGFVLVSAYIGAFLCAVLGYSTVVVLDQDLDPRPDPTCTSYKSVQI
jgi:hypothetical protein